MVRIVINHNNIVDVGFELEPSEDALEALQSGLDIFKIDIQFKSHRNGSQGVLDIVLARGLQLYLSDLFTVVHHSKAAVKLIYLNISGPDFGLWRQSVGNGAPLDLRDDAPYIGIIQAEHDGTVERHLVGKFYKCVFDILQVVINIQVFRFNV